MSYKQYLQESVETIKLYRGVRNKFNYEVGGVMIPRQDRKPRDTDKAVNELVNQELKLEGKPLRSSVIFMTPSKSEAEQYGYAIEVELGVNTNLWYAPGVSDFYTWYQRRVDRDYVRENKAMGAELFKLNDGNHPPIGGLMLATTECIKLWPKVPTALTTGINKKMMEAIAKEVDIGVREVAKKYAKSVKKISIEDLQSIHKSEWVELMADGPVKIVKI